MADVTKSAERSRVEPIYRVAPRGRAPEEWCIVPVRQGEPDAPAPVSGFQTQEAAQKECDRLNELWAVWEPDEGRRDAVLGRMLNRGLLRST